jgi:hypothetical protein
MAINRTNQELVERLVDGFLQYDYTETWQVDASGPAAALATAGLPTIGTEYLITGVAQPVYCYQRQPRRRNDTQAKAVFDVVCNFTNAVARYERTVDGLPANEPEQIVPRVDIAFEEYSEQSPTAQFIGIFEASTDHTLMSPLTSRAIPPYLPTPQFGAEVAIVNSANEPIQNVNKRKHTKRITYWTWHRDWDAAWDDFLDAVNNAAVTITQSDKDGQRLRYTFPAYELLINDIIKEDHWRDGKLYFRRGVVFAHNPIGWFTELPDQGFNENIFFGQLLADGSLITPTVLDEWFGEDRATYELAPIVHFQPVNFDEVNTDSVSVAPADPQALNGYGRQLKYPTPDGPAYEPKKLVYMSYNVKDFSTLGIT